MDRKPDPSQGTLCNEEEFKDLSDIYSEGDEDLAPFPIQSRLYRRSSAILLTTLLLIFASIVFVAWNTRQPHYDQCGTTAAEARARGCVFETTGFSWVTKECYDPDTENEFLGYLATNEIQVFRDANYTEVVSMEESRLGEGIGFFVRQKYHRTHCGFLIKKLHRAVAAGRKVDGYSHPVHHTEHCIGQLLETGADFRQEDIQISYTKWPYCGRGGGYNVDWNRRKEWVDYE